MQMLISSQTKRKNDIQPTCDSFMGTAQKYVYLECVTFIVSAAYFCALLVFNSGVLCSSF